MKLLSTQRNSDGKQLVCEDAVFDPNLFSITRIDTAEKIIILKYDFSECGNPLNLPFEAHNVDFLVKVTQHNIHISALIELYGNVRDNYEEYTNELGDVEFGVRMTIKEKFSFLLSIFFAMLKNTNRKIIDEEGWVKE